MTMSDREFEGRVAVVTGAAMGIGKAAPKLPRPAHPPPGRHRPARPAARLPRRSMPVVAQGDLRGDRCFRHGRHGEDAAEAVAIFGGIDIPVNNAARATAAASTIDEASWNTVISNNPTNWRGMRVCVPEMIKRKRGAVVNMSSAGAGRLLGWAVYAAAKGGINALTSRRRSTSRLRHPAPPPRPHHHDAAQPENIRDDRRSAGADRHLDEAHPIGRFGEAHEVADAVVPCRRARPFITGDLARRWRLVVRGE